jgi:Kef-type K+ transport system membrane component KefB
MNTEMVRRQIRRAVFVSSSSFFAPALVAFAVGAVFLRSFGLPEDFVVALAFSVPSISIISVIVVHRGLLDRASGQLILASVTVSDILAFVLLASVTRSLPNTLVTIAYTALFIGAFIVLDWFLRKKPRKFRAMLEQAARYFKREEMPFAALLIVGLLISALFELIGISYIVGAFFAGLIFHEGLIGRVAFRGVTDTLSKMSNAFFIPLFFGLSGAETFFPSQDISYLPVIVILLAGTLGVSYFSTRVLLRRTSVLDDKDARAVSATMCGRGAVGVVIASVANSSGLIGSAGFAIVIVGTVASSIIASFLLREWRV